MYRRLMNPTILALVALITIQVSIVFAGSNSRFSNYKALTADTQGVLSSSRSDISSRMAEGPERNYVDSVNQFALGFMKNFPKNYKGNVFFSPISLVSILDMTLIGTVPKSKTQVELNKVLGYEGRFKDDTEPHQSLKTVNQKVKGLRKGTELEFALKNLLLINKTKFQLDPTYEKKVSTYHDVKFEEFTQANGLDTKINNWVKEQTRNMIPQLVQQSDIEKAGAVFLNAAYFKADWKTKFLAYKVIKRNFFNDGLENGKKTITFMESDRSISYHDFTNDKNIPLPCKAISLEFSIGGGKEMDMVFILPNKKDGLPELVNSITESKLSKIYSSLSENFVHLEIPKFDFSQTSPAKQILENMGMHSLFEGSDDLSKMLKSGTGARVDNIIHKAHITIDEEGAKAAAATGMIAVPMSLQIPSETKFIANHPFLFVIRHVKTNLPLFIGQVNAL